MQVGDIKSHDLTLMNPFDKTIFVNLFIGSKTFESSEKVKSKNGLDPYVE